MRAMSSQDFRVLSAVEKGMKDHGIVPATLIAANAQLRHGGCHKVISSLLRDKLLSHDVTKKQSFDGYRVTNAGYDVLALHNLKQRGIIAAIGQKVGTGKESDIYLAVTPKGEQVVLKFHRLGRTSFRNIRQKRDYFGTNKQQAQSWLFSSRLSALKEFAFMKALFDQKYPTPTPIAHNRHIVCMSLVRGLPLYQIHARQLSVEQAADIYDQAVDLATRLARDHGLVHCDLNEFNLLVDLSGVQQLVTETDDPYVRHSGLSVATESSDRLSKPAWEQSLEDNDRLRDKFTPQPVAFLQNGEAKPVVTLIDFPQMISTQHPNAVELFDRDVACLRRFFELKLHCSIPVEDPRLESLIVDASSDATERLDKELKASGFSGDFTRGEELIYFDRNTHLDGPIEEEDEGSTNGEIIRVDVDKEASDNDQGSVSDEDEEGEQAPESRLDIAVVHAGDHERVLEQAKERVRKQIQQAKRSSRKAGAFRRSNQNKSYVKGKRSRGINYDL